VAKSTYIEGDPIVVMKTILSMLWVRIDAIRGEIREQPQGIIKNQEVRTRKQLEKVDKKIRPTSSTQAGRTIKEGGAAFGGKANLTPGHG